MFLATDRDSNIFSWPWIPSMGLNLDFRWDGLSQIFTILILGIGLLIQIYSFGYMKNKPRRIRFHIFLLLFMVSMLGVVLADHLLLLFVFWELTTVTSYLLIGFDHEKENARKNALQAMLVTGAGGLCLLAGLILLAEMTQSYSLSHIILSQKIWTDHPLFIPSMLCLLLGCFTKSAQFPFHFWLPGAMSAPTPVSAYLHSATMVKAGIYLMARVSPIYSYSEIWSYLLISIGAITLIWSSWMSLKSSDLKSMLAYSTIAALGQLTLLLGWGSNVALTAALTFLVGHSLYKASLFMAVGNIDKATGTRLYEKLSGLRTLMPKTFYTVILASASALGVPPFLGFLAKEYSYKAALIADPFLMGLCMLSHIATGAMTFIVLFKPFLKSHLQNNLHKNLQASQQLDFELKNIQMVDRKISLWAPPLLLAFGGLALGTLLLPALQSYFIQPGFYSISFTMNPKPLILWQGFNLPLAMSFIVLSTAFILFKAVNHIRPKIIFWSDLIPSGSKIYDLCVQSILHFAGWTARRMQSSRLADYLFISIGSLVLLIFFLMPLPSQISLQLTSLTLLEVLLALMMVFGAIVACRAQSRLMAVVSLSVLGFGVTLYFMIYSSPDVAITNLLVETLVVIFVALLMKHLPSLYLPSRHSLQRRTVNIVIASIIGVFMTFLLLHILSNPLDPKLANFFGQKSLQDAQGSNVVNVILVDFRGFDTMGEMMVVVIAMLAAAHLLRKNKSSENSL